MCVFLDVLYYQTGPTIATFLPPSSLHNFLSPIPSHRSLSVWFFLESFFLTASTITGRSPINTGWSHHLGLKGRFFFYSRWCPHLKLIGQLLVPVKTTHRAKLISWLVEFFKVSFYVLEEALSHSPCLILSCLSRQLLSLSLAGSRSSAWGT